jgi:hypothetical protein
VDNTDLPHITAECVTWPAVQRILRYIWAQVQNAEWKPEDHAEKYAALKRSESLKLKVEGFPKIVGDKIKEKGQDAVRDMLWSAFDTWDVSGEPSEVERYDRKKLIRDGVKENRTKLTWPLPFEGDVSITSVLTAGGWDGDEILSLKGQLFENREDTGIHLNCTEEQVCWPDLQQAFRTCVEDDAWDEDNNKEWPCLDGRRTTLRNKVTEENVKGLLEGCYRMYCKPEDGDPFSYGIDISDVTKTEDNQGTFNGKSPKDAYVVADGKYFIDEHHRCYITYGEVWGDFVDNLTARVKSNSKFQCESTGGFEQKAANYTVNPQYATYHEAAPFNVKKYHENST